jgi:hypothetical protein
MQFEATGDTWGHGPGNTGDSDANGLGGTVSLAESAYRDTPALHAGRIIGDSLPFNRLVGLREYRTPGDADTKEIDIGRKPASAIPVVSALSTERPYRLRLGLHDSYEWSNNNGQIAVTITFAE